MQYLRAYANYIDPGSGRAVQTIATCSSFAPCGRRNARQICILMHLPLADCQSRCCTLLCRLRPAQSRAIVDQPHTQLLPARLTIEVRKHVRMHGMHLWHESLLQTVLARTQSFARRPADILCRMQREVMMTCCYANAVECMLIESAYRYISV